MSRSWWCVTIIALTVLSASAREPSGGKKAATLEEDLLSLAGANESLLIQENNTAWEFVAKDKAGPKFRLTFYKKQGKVGNGFIEVIYPNGTTVWTAFKFSAAEKDMERSLKGSGQVFEQNADPHIPYKLDGVHLRIEGGKANILSLGMVIESVELKGEWKRVKRK
jgi:hypothetical protein